MGLRFERRMNRRLLRWMYYTWKTVKLTVISLLCIVLVVVSLIFGLLQLDVTKRYATFKTNQWLEETFVGTIRVESITGLIPFSIGLQNITVSHGDTVASLGSLRASFAYHDVLGKRIRVRSLVMDHLTVDVDTLLATAFERKKPVLLLGSEKEVDASWTFELPNISLFNGTVTRDTLRIEGIELHTFAEFGPQISYVDVSSLNFEIPSLSSDAFQISGQYYRDSRFIEFNAIEIAHGQSLFKFGIVGDTFLDTLTVWKAEVDTSTIFPSDFKWVKLNLPEVDQPFTLSGLGNGTKYGLELRNFRVGYRSSFIHTDATLLHIDDPKRLFGELRVKSSRILRNELTDWAELPEFPDFRLNGTVSGDRRHVTSRATVTTGAGKAQINARLGWANGFRISAKGSFEEINLAGLRPKSPVTSLNGTFGLTGSGVALSEIDADMRVDLSVSSISETVIDTAMIAIKGAEGKYLVTGNAFSPRAGGLSLAGYLDIRGAEPKLDLRGNGMGVDMATVAPGRGLAKTDLDFRFQTSVTGLTPERIHGEFSVDVDRAMIGGVKQKAHQLYLDLDSPDRDDRTLRFTSNIADATISGDIQIQQFAAMGVYWSNWLRVQIQKQFTFEKPDSRIDVAYNGALEDVRVTVEASLKDLRLLNAYVPSLPQLGSRSDVTLLVNATSDRLLVNGGIRGDSIMVGDVKTLRSNLQVSTQFVHQSDLNEFSNVKVQLAAGLLKVGNFEMREYTLDLVLSDDTLTVNQRANRIGENAQLRNRLTATLQDSSLTVSMDEFRLSNRAYVWESPGKPQFVYDSAGNFDIKNLLLINEKQIIDVEGRFSSLASDSVVYKIENLDLAKLSELIGGRIAFSGIMNATIASKTLGTDPAINGRVDVDRLVLNNRLFGDVRFQSSFNPAFGRFDTRLNITGENAGNDVDVNGYFYASDNGGTRDTTFKFDIAVKKADLWVVNLFNKDLFQTIDGRLSGGGWLAGNFNNFDFDAAFNIDQARVVPYFLLTDYSVSGPIKVNRKDGLTLNDLQLTDRFGGRGVLSGRLDFNDFKPDKDINMTMVMNNLQFLNNTFTPEVPFYGVAYGTGTITLTGKTSSPFLQTRGQIVTSANSRIAIPFLDQTSVEEKVKFLEFVDSFDEVYRPVSVQQSATTAGTAANTTGSRFVELFTLNLSFAAPPGSTVQLVFDPLTGEILNAQGSGSVQIRLEDEQFNVFGTFNVNQGDYTFVAGDIFRRKFDLRDGGTLIWEGPADNARLNVLAAYRSRPDISVVSQQNVTAAVSTRVPIDLVLSITGTLLSIQNDFYFEFPNAIDVTQNSTQLAFLNSDEQKLVQATSLLFTGGFIPPNEASGGQYTRVADDLQSRGLSQLLSSQVNSLLNSRLSFLDVDFNFSGFDQTDIGVAVRLFDDRLVLRGESQFVQGNEASLGDLGATFRINRAFSIEIFHRRDPTLQAALGNQANIQSNNITGMGLEAQVQFNTWRELRHRVWGSIRRFFSIDDDRSPKSTNTAVR